MCVILFLKFSFEIFLITRGNVEKVSDEVMKAAIRKDGYPKKEAVNMKREEKEVAASLCFFRAFCSR